MPSPCYISIHGMTQGNITAGAFTADSVGNIFVEGHEDEMLVQSVQHGVDVPTDPQSGQPSGQRVHQPLVVTCSLNKATPLIFNSVANGEMLSEVKLKWYRTSVEGKQEHFFTYKLTDAIATNISVFMPHVQNSDTSEYTQLVDITFTYRKIDLGHELSATSGGDDWRVPNV